MDIFLAIGLVLALVGAPLAWFGIQQYRKQGARYAKATATWVKALATVIDARLVDRESSNSDGDSNTWYEPRLHYRYAVGGAEFEGDRTALCATPQFSLFDTAQKWLLAHSPGKEIDLWYDPANPSDSAPVLDKPSLFRAIVMVVVGVGFVIFGGMIMLHMV